MSWQSALVKVDKRVNSILFFYVFQLASLESEKLELLELWEKRRVQFEQCMELQLFNRDCEHANATMTKQEVGTCQMFTKVVAHTIIILS